MSLASHDHWGAQDESLQHKKNFLRQLDSHRLESLSPIQGEIPKSSDDILLIHTFAEILTDDIQSLGVKPRPKFRPDQVHLLPGSLLLENFPKKDILVTAGFYSPTADSVYINMDFVGNDWAKFIMVTGHELLEGHSYVDLIIRDGAVTNTRLGYRKFSPQGEADTKFSGFTDGMINTILLEIFTRNINKFEYFGVSPDQLFQSYKGLPYMKYHDLNSSIFHHVSDVTGMPPKKVYSEIKKCLFSGDMTPLKLIDQVFGENSLDVLGIMGGSFESNVTEVFDKISYYFTEDLARADRESLKNDIIRSQIDWFKNK